MKRPQLIKYAYIIAGKTTRGGDVFAENRAAAEKQVKAMLQEGERIHSLTINRR